MGVQDLQEYLKEHVSEAYIPVDLLKLGRNFAAQRKPHGKTKGGNKAKLGLVLDGECCLDRLYGGFFSDWVSGGQWSRTMQFLAILIQTVQVNNIDLAVFFNGCLEQERMKQWVTQQKEIRNNINQVLRHIQAKGTPPPKVWWSPPVCLRTCLRMALRYLNVPVMSSMDDHHQEVIAYCRENGFEGLLAEDADYAIFNPPHYFSSEQLKLTYKGSLETKEFLVQEVAKQLDVPSDRMCIFAALLGNHILTEEQLTPFYKKLCPEQVSGKYPSFDVIVKTVAAFVASLTSISNPEAVAIEVFGSSNDSRCELLKQCVHYYMNGTKDGFLRYNPPMPGNRRNANRSQTGKPALQTQNSSKPENMLKFASETDECEEISRAAYNEAMAGAPIPPQIIVNEAANDFASESSENGNSVNHTEEKKSEDSTSATKNHAMNGGSTVLLSSSSSNSSSISASPSRLTPNGTWNSNGQQDSPVSETREATENNHIPKPLRIPPEVIRTASERHQKGLMLPYIYQILTQKEIKLPVVLEDEVPKDLPSIHHFYRPVRQMVYAVLFNLHHHIYLANQNADNKSEEKSKVPEICVNEWVWSKNNPYATPEEVIAQPIGWAVPTVQKLWFGSTVDDKRRRLRAFLTCMKSDTQLILNPSYVPQHLLMMACVLRYMMSFPDKRLLRKHELDAFLVQAFSPELMNADGLQDLQLPVVTTRGVQLAAFFMEGVEMSLLANDACGAPVPWLMCCPWLFFDGKLFQAKLHKATSAKDLFELCDHQMDEVVKVERMRQAILEGLEFRFARPPLPQMNSVLAPPSGFRMPMPPPPPYGMMTPQEQFTGDLGRGRGLVNRRLVPSQGGKLQIAGVTVGSWGPNYGSVPRGRAGNFIPQSYVPKLPAVGMPRPQVYPCPYIIPAGGERSQYVPRGASRGTGRGVRRIQPPNNLRKTGTNKKSTTKETDRRELQNHCISVESTFDPDRVSNSSSDVLCGGDSEAFLKGQLSNLKVDTESKSSPSTGKGDVPDENTASE